METVQAQDLTHRPLPPRVPRAVRSGDGEESYNEAAAQAELNVDAVAGGRAHPVNGSGKYPQDPRLVLG